MRAEPSGPADRPSPNCLERHVQCGRPDPGIGEWTTRLRSCGTWPPYDVSPSRFAGGAFVQSVAVDPAGRTLITGGGDGVVRGTSCVASGSVTSPTRHHGAGLEFDVPDASAWGTEGPWGSGTSPAAGPWKRQTPATAATSPASLQPGRPTLASGSEDGTVVLWDVASRRHLGCPVAAPPAATAAPSVGGRSAP